MKRVLVTYKTKEGRADENASLIEKVFEELSATQPEGLGYASFRMADGVTFVHLAEISSADGSNPLAQTTAFKAFQSELKERCEVPPSAKECGLVGSYNLM